MPPALPAPAPTGRSAQDHAELPEIVADARCRLIS